MKKAAEQELVVKAIEGTRITRDNQKIVEEPASNRNAKVSTNTSADDLDDLFPIVEASKLSLEDEFLKHEPETDKQKRLKKSIVAGIKSGLSDFRRPIMDPSEDEDGNIVFEKGNKPAVNHSANWWNKKASEFMPTKNSRLVTEQEYEAFLGVLIKELIEEGYQIEEAWKAVCDDSRDLGHYRNSKDSKHGFEITGSRQVGRWFDLANTCKIIKYNETSSYVLAGGNYNCEGDINPLTDVWRFLNPNVDYYDSVGWIVFDV